MQAHGIPEGGSRVRATAIPPGAVRGPAGRRASPARLCRSVAAVWLTISSLLVIASCVSPAAEPATEPAATAPRPADDAPAAGRLPILAMPGRPHTGPLPPLTAAERALAAGLEADVHRLAATIGERSATPFGAAGLRAAEEFLGAALVDAGYEPVRQEWQVRGITVANLVAEVPGAAKADEIVVVGGHYDSVAGCPGADDNASGTAATLALARGLARARPARTLRFAFFANEEPPWFQTEEMGSLKYARRCRERGEKIVGMLSLETMGYFSDAPGSQKFDAFPPLRLVYPDTGNFIAFVSDVRSGGFTTRVVESFRRTTRFPAHGLALPDAIDGIGWSDHWSFAQVGYPAAMVTDTAVFRYPHYHAAEDTPDKLDFDRMARVVAGLRRVTAELAEVPADDGAAMPAERVP